MNTFSILANSTRRNIVKLLAQKGQLSASNISDKFKITPSAISQHLKVLRQAKIINIERRAQQRLYQINPGSIEEIEGWVKEIKKNWEIRLNKLDKVLKHDLKGGVK